MQIHSLICIPRLSAWILQIKRLRSSFLACLHGLLTCCLLSALSAEASFALQLSEQLSQQPNQRPNQQLGSPAQENEASAEANQPAQSVTLKPSSTPSPTSATFTRFNRQTFQQALQYLQEQDYLNASFLLEQLVALNPQAAEPRWYLATTYFALGEYELAQQQFELLNESMPPAEYAANIQQYLTALPNRLFAQQGGWWANVATGIGYTDNANNANREDTFLIFLLAEENIATSSTLARINLTGGYTHPFSDEHKVMLTAFGGYTQYPDAEFVNQSNVGAQARYAWQRSSHTASTTLAANQVWLGDDDNYFLSLAAMSYGYTFTHNFSLQASVQYSELDFVEAFDNRDVTQWLYRLETDYRPALITNDQLLISVSYSQDTPTQSDGFHGKKSRQYFLQYAFPIQPQLTLKSRVAYTVSRYDTEFFGDTRQSTQSLVSAELTQANFWDTGWDAVFSTRYTRHESTIDLYDYTSWLVTIGVQHVFY